MTEYSEVELELTSRFLREVAGLIIPPHQVVDHDFGEQILLDLKIACGIIRSEWLTYEQQGFDDDTIMNKLFSFDEKNDDRLSNLTWRSVYNYLLTLADGRKFWGFDVTKDPAYPHVCPRCKSQAYIGFMKIECKQKCLES